MLILFTFFSFHSEHGRPLLGLPRLFEAQNFLRGEVEEPLDPGQERSRRKFEIYFYRHRFGYRRLAIGYRRLAMSAGPPAPGCHNLRR